jgi:hypothetical protein
VVTEITEYVQKVIGKICDAINEMDDQGLMLMKEQFLMV